MSGLGILKKIRNELTVRKRIILGFIQTDREIDADNYDDVARLKEVERIEKFVKRLEKEDRNGKANN